MRSPPSRAAQSRRYLWLAAVAFHPLEPLQYFPADLESLACRPSSTRNLEAVTVLLGSGPSDPATRGGHRGTFRYKAVDD